MRACGCLSPARRVATFLQKVTELACMQLVGHDQVSRVQCFRDYHYILLMLSSIWLLWPLFKVQHASPCMVLVALQRLLMWRLLEARRAPTQAARGFRLRRRACAWRWGACCAAWASSACGAPVRSRRSPAH